MILISSYLHMFSRQRVIKREAWWAIHLDVNLLKTSSTTLHCPRPSSVSYKASHSKATTSY